MPRLRVQSEPFDFGHEANLFAQSVQGAGAVVTFTGIVRDNQGTLTGMEIEHYPAMTLPALTKIRQQAMDRWSLTDALIIHRFGPLAPDEMIMMVATAAPHRADAFQAAEFLMDYLKSRAPFWKKEAAHDGTTAWVAAKDADEAALRRWTPAQD